MTSPMPVVSDTSPILGLAAIERLDLLRAQFGEILIPPAVMAELKTETEFRGAKSIRQALKRGWLYVLAVQNVHLVHALGLELDQGESEAIALALEVNAPLVLLDEYDGRSKARALGLTTIGALGILLRAKRDGNIQSLKEAMQALRQEAGFFITEELYQQILAQAGERD